MSTSSPRLNSGLLHAIRLFVRVVDARGFTAAALQSDLTAAQVSRMIGELEQRLGTKLLHRNSRHVSLTGPGERYLIKCRSILDLVDEAENEARDAATKPAGTLKVSCMSSFGRHHLLPLLMEYLQRYPDVKVEYSTRQNAPDVLAEGIDSSVYFAQELPHSTLVGRKVGGVRGILCARPDFLSRHGTPSHPEDLMTYSCLKLVNITRDWQLTDGDSTITLPVTGPFRGDSSDAVLSAALSGLGIALLPPWSIIDSLKTGDLVPVLPQWRTPEIGVYSLISSRRYLPAQTRAWIDLIAEKLPVALGRDELMVSRFVATSTEV
ncbi:LysR family transcriptional regulator [Paraburkholderia edwinii]|jgi:DNA-binding transcriptional LysR family regulator|uniref:LysR family transcriptional regulator n=1 Tax=Paraburkholderia edwinii TaxID=2861782 RepID=A0ABX8UIB4_9BURK|nr:LysR family transcriptional regulator [Paraburkholderia edwinii]QYD68673.1 LysR family transcriptional regulator [Paraburkholderia edwinii]